MMTAVMTRDAETTYHLQGNDLVWDEGPDVTGGYVLRLRDMPDEERPREKLLAAGPQALSLAELLAVLWGVGTRKEDVLAMAKRTLREYGERSVSSEHDPQRLSVAAGIPIAKACQLVAGFELGRRFYASRSGRPVQPGSGLRISARYGSQQ
jgi:DNA repair protein RadC